MFEDKKLVSLRELARALLVPASRLKDEADSGRLPHLRAGSQYLFDLETVRDALLDRAKSEGLTHREAGELA